MNVLARVANGGTSPVPEYTSVELTYTLLVPLPSTVHA